MPVDITVVRETIQRELKSIRTLGDAAEKLNISPETLRKEFIRRTKLNVSDFIAHLRVEEMKRRLLMTDERCFEICFEVGFDREDTGAKFFKRMTGMTMDQYRASAPIPITPTLNANRKRQPQTAT